MLWLTLRKSGLVIYDWLSITSSHVLSNVLQGGLGSLNSLEEAMPRDVSQIVCIKPHFQNRALP